MFRTAFLLVFMLFVSESNSQFLHIGAEVGFGPSYIEMSEGIFDEFSGRSVLNSKLSAKLVYQFKSKITIGFFPTSSNYSFREYNNPTSYGKDYKFKFKFSHFPILLGRTFKLNNRTRLILLGGPNFSYAQSSSVDISSICGWFQLCNNETVSFEMDDSVVIGYMVEALYMVDITSHLTFGGGINYHNTLEENEFVFQDKINKISFSNVSGLFSAYFRLDFSKKAVN